MNTKSKRILFVVLFVVSVMFSLLCVRQLKNYGKIYHYKAGAFVYKDGCYQSPETILDKGSYTIFVKYSAAENLAYLLQAGADVSVSGALEAGKHAESAISFTLDRDFDDIYLKIYADDSEDISIEGVQISSEQLLNTDDIYYMAVIWLVFGLAVLILNRLNDLSKGTKTALLILFAGFLFVNIVNYEPFLRFSSDIRVHLLRIEGTKDALKGGQFPVLMYPNAFKGYGEIGALYPKAFLYPAVFLRLCGVSLLTAAKTLFYLINIATLFVGYYSFDRLCQLDGVIKNNMKGICDRETVKIIAAVSAVLYTLFPYRMYVMGYSGSAFGRGLSMIFLPLVLPGMLLIYEAACDKSLKLLCKGILMLTAGVSGILWSHLMNFVITLLFIIIIALFLITQGMVKRIKIGLFPAGLAVSALFSALICAGYLAQLVGFYFDGLNLSYLQFNIYDKLFKWQEFFLSPWNIAVFVYIIYVMVLHFRCKSRLSGIELLFAVLTVVFALMATRLLPYDRLMENEGVKAALSTFQNLKRFYFLTGFMAVYLAMKGMCLACKWNKRAGLGSMTVLVIVSMILCIAPFKDYFGCDVLLDESTGYTENEQLEYLPEGTVFEECFSNSAIVSDESVLSVSEYYRNGAAFNIEYTCQADEVYTDLPLFYYPQCRTALNEKGEKLKTGMGEGHRMRVYLEKTDKPARIITDVRVPAVYTVFTVISIISAICYFIAGYILNNTMQNNGDSLSHE